MDLIEQAVLPLKEEAIRYAEKYAQETIASVIAKLEQANHDINKAAPFPNSATTTKSEYMAAMIQRRIFENLTSRVNPVYSFKQPVYVQLNDIKVQSYIMQAKQDAANQYERFVRKLQCKIGSVQSATLQGTSVWIESFLNIVKESGEKQCWKTRLVMNHSKYGRIFAQFPTRQIKIK